MTDILQVFIQKCNGKKRIQDAHSFFTSSTHLSIKFIRKEISMSEINSSKPPSTGRRILLAVILVGIVLALFFGFRTVRGFIRIHREGLRPIETNVENIRGWMTVDYISRVYRVPENDLFQMIGVPPNTNPRSSLADLNRIHFYGQPGVVLENVKKGILNFQARHDAPPGGQK
jgi:hypothetical protein